MSINTARSKRRGCPILARPLCKGGNHTDRTMGFAFHAACAPNERA